MSLGYVTHCDGCSCEAEQWPDDIALAGWVVVNFSDDSHDRQDYCPQCWAKMLKAIEVANDRNL